MPQPLGVLVPAPAQSLSVEKYTCFNVVYTCIVKAICSCGRHRSSLHAHDFFKKLMQPCSCYKWAMCFMGAGYQIEMVCGVVGSWSRFSGKTRLTKPWTGRRMQKALPSHAGAFFIVANFFLARVCKYASPAGCPADF